MAPYDPADYVHATKLKVKAALEESFAGAAVYLADLDNIPAYAPAGTFCLEAAASYVALAATPAGQIAVTLRIWTYVEEVDAAAAEERLSALTQKLEAVLAAAARPYPGPAGDWLAVEILQTTFLPRDKGRGRRRGYLRAARTDWRVRLAACR
jgi:hypothetical protein